MLTNRTLPKVGNLYYSRGNWNPARAVEIIYPEPDTWNGAFTYYRDTHRGCEYRIRTECFHRMYAVSPPPPEALQSSPAPAEARSAALEVTEVATVGVEQDAYRIAEDWLFDGLWVRIKPREGGYTVEGALP